MDIPAWGIGVIALYSLLQIPAVLLVARYCEVDTEDLPTPPMRAQWQEESPQQSQTSSMSDESTPGQFSADHQDRGSKTGPGVGQGGSSVARTGGGPDHVRCRNCGASNDPAFARCQDCVSEL